MGVYIIFGVVHRLVLNLRRRKGIVPEGASLTGKQEQPAERYDAPRITRVHHVGRLFELAG